MQRGNALHPSRVGGESQPRCSQAALPRCGPCSCSYNTAHPLFEHHRRVQPQIAHAVVVFPRRLHRQLSYSSQCISCAEAADTIDNGSSDDEGQEQRQQPQPEAGEYVVVNFYHLVDVADPQQVMEAHKQYLAGKDVQGRIYISAQGINAQYGGAVDDARGYAVWVAEQPQFKGLRYSVWPARGRMFPKLRLKYKPNLISLGGGMSNLPVTDPTARATPLEPAAWKDMLTNAQAVVLDVRNDYEWDAGHFKGAARPSEEVFNETPVGEGADDLPVPLQTLEDKSAPVMMYCTGGIRCDVYSTFLRRKGFTNLYTLEGGIQNYLLHQGSKMWDGSLYVFDGRMAIPADNPMSCGVSAAELGGLPAAVPCQVCGAKDASLPHVNCANIDCNELFIACGACKTRYRGCCCEACMSAPRLLRPAKAEGGHYAAWGNYADEDSVGPRMATGRSREGRVARRARRREALRGKREGQLHARAARKAMVREAMAAAQQAEAGQQLPVLR